MALDTTPSTMDEAYARAAAGDPGKLWITAREQTKGRGRHGRNFVSPRGNLFASLLLINPCAPHIAPQLGLLSGLALHDAVAAVSELAAPRVLLKWPNDLLLAGGKLSGILIEGHQLAFDRFVVIIGIGVNLATAPEGMPYPTASLSAVVGPVDVDALASALTASMARRLSEWDAGRAFGPIKDAWLARAAGVGGPVTVRLPEREVRGTFVGLDPSGRLLLDGPHGREVIDAGDLFFGAGATRAGSAA
jgi:BirA family transcriptional regulator, biotin operon repressor / biotin---[acetyl-CoA-carboxylase] ligase